MIRRSVSIAAVALVLSLLLHLVGFRFIVTERPAPHVAEDPVDTVELGTTFEDFVEEPQDPVEPEPAEVPDPPVEEVVQPEQPEVPISDALVAARTPEQTVSPDIEPNTAPDPDPLEADVTRPVEPAPADSGSRQDAPVVPPVGIEADTDTTSVNPDTLNQVAQPPEGQSPAAPEPEVLAALPAPETLSEPVAPTTRSAVEPEVPEAIIEAPPEEETERAPDVSELAAAVSVRPRLPDRRPPPESEPAPEDGLTANQRTVLESFRNFDNLRNPDQLSESPLTTYQRQGVNPFSASASRNQPGGRGGGNSDRTNYVGLVLVHLNQSEPVYVSARGFAQVFFQIDPDGSLAWVDIVDTSGSAELERAAKEQVRRAAPFPRPPNGTSRKLSFYYQNG